MHRNRRWRPRRAAMLHATLGERLPAIPTVTLLPPHRPWAPSPGTRAFMAAISALPKIAASIGMVIAAHQDAQVEILPGTPTTIAFIAGGRIKGLFVLPIGEQDARRLLGQAQPQRDIAADRLWEETRQAELLPIDSAESDDAWAN